VCRIKVAEKDQKILDIIEEMRVLVAEDNGK